MLILLILLILLFGGGFGYLGHQNFGPIGAGGIGVGTILVIVLIFWLLGAFR